MAWIPIHAEAHYQKLTTGGCKVTTTNNQAIAEELGGLIDDLRNASESKREKAIAKIVTLMYPHFRNWTPKFCRVSGDVTGNHSEDVISIVALRVLAILREATEEGKHSSVINWYSYLYAAGRYAALAYFNSSDVTAASGMTAVLRKQRHIARIKNGLRSTLGPEPDDAELVEAANTNMRARRTNPEKQGVLVDLSDLHIIVPTADIDDHDRAIDSADDQAILAPVEGRELARLIVEACYEVSAELGHTSDVWIGGMYAEPPTLGTASDVALNLNVSASKATRLLGNARELARDLCWRRFGISFPA
jgi:hypothetical protein